jgi:hypothetical protein
MELEGMDGACVCVLVSVVIASHERSILVYQMLILGTRPNT